LKQRIPCTPEYRRDLFDQVRSLARSRLVVRDELPPEHSRFRLAVTGHVVRLAAMDVWKDAIARPVNTAILYLVLFVWWILPLVLYALGRFAFNTIVGSTNGISDLGSAWFYSAVGAFLGLGILAGVASLASARRSLVPARVYTFLAIFIGALFTAEGLRSALHGPPYTVEQFTRIYTLLGSPLIGLLVVLSDAIERVIARMVERRQRAVVPESAAIVHLLHASFLARGDAWRRVPVVREMLLDDLGIVSNAFLTDFPNTFRSGDPIADAASARHYVAVAEGIRSLKKLVLVPRADSSAKLRAKTQAAATALLEGAWDMLPRQDPVRLGQTTLVSVWRAARAVLVAIVPVAFLALAKRYGVELPPELKQFAEIGAWVWAFVGLMIAIDPDFATKISTSKDVWSFLRGKGGSG
jgi:hypothetical protein